MDLTSFGVAGMDFSRDEIFLCCLAFLGVPPILRENDRMVEIHVVLVLDGVKGDRRY